jgi:cation diffusion facilitator CzcD-associated flavoprotein CzcO
VAIIGAGMSGIGMAAKLRMAGIESFHLYEQSDDFGGTWHANTYPGLSCDIPSRYYQYKFAPNPHWTKIYSPGQEIRDYLAKIADEFGLRERTSFRTTVSEAEWIDGRWHLRTADGREAHYDFIVTAAGGLVHAKTPDIRGLADFGGRVFHSAAWDHSTQVDGRRVAVIGTGSTGMQLTRALAPVAARFELYQRTPQWILPLPNHRYTVLTRAICRRFPRLNLTAYRGWQWLYEVPFARATVRDGLSRRSVQIACRLHLRRVRDPDLRRRFTPPDQPMCKRIVMGTGFYRLFERRSVELVDAGIDHVEERGIVTLDGRLHELDVIVLATGFDAHAYLRPMELIGPGGLRLSDLWSREPFSYRTVGLPGFPNVLMLIGPCSPLGSQSLFATSEHQQDFALSVIEEWRRGEIDALAPTPEATERFMSDVREALPHTVWATGCASWYIGADGLPNLWPWMPGRLADLLRRRDGRDWEAVPGPAARPSGDLASAGQP